jgi:hypothetical protein
VGGEALMPLLVTVVTVLGVLPQTTVATALWFSAMPKPVAVTMQRRTGRVNGQVVGQPSLESLPIALRTEGLVDGRALEAWMRSVRSEAPEQFKSRLPALAAVAGAVLGVPVMLPSVVAHAVGLVLMLAVHTLRMTPQRVVAIHIAHAIALAAVLALVAAGSLVGRTARDVDRGVGFAAPL